MNRSIVLAFLSFAATSASAADFIPLPAPAVAPTFAQIDRPLYLDPFISSEPPAPSTSDQPLDVSTFPLALTLDATTAPAPPEHASTDDEPPSGTDADLVKKLNNPVANLISVPFQYNIDFGIGPRNSSKNTLNIQPVIPLSISKDYNVIIRTILPVIYQDSPADGTPSRGGLGDTTQSFFLSPKAPIHDWIVGVGPVFLWPTATNDQFGSGKWGIGPTAVLLQQKHGWTYGILANQIWSYAGASDRQSVNATFLQPFISYSFPTYTTLTLNTESTYDWAAHQWTIPLNLMAAQLIKVGKLPIQLQLGGRYYAEGPSGGPEWGLRFNLVFLFPK